MTNLKRFGKALESAAECGRYAADMWPGRPVEEAVETWIMAHSDEWLSSWSESACDAMRDAFRTAWAAEWARQHAA